MAVGQTRVLADPLVRYVLDSRTVHHRLREALTQIAGMSLLAMMPGRAPPALDGPLNVARDAMRLIPGEVGALPVPPPARHHHRHLTAAVDALARTLDLLTGCLRNDAAESLRPALVASLRCATDELRAATRLLPGFEMVDLRQACCAAHRARGPISCA